MFAYCVNNPVNYYDPTGEFAVAAVLGGAAAILPYMLTMMVVAVSAYLIISWIVDNFTFPSISWDSIFMAESEAEDESNGEESSDAQNENNKVNIPKNVDRQSKKLSPEAKKGYDKAIDALKSGDTRGLNDHALHGDRSGQRAIDIKGTGKGRGGGRIIYEYGKNGEINVKEIIFGHRY